MASCEFVASFVASATCQEHGGASVYFSIDSDQLTESELMFKVPPDDPFDLPPAS